MSAAVAPPPSAAEIAQKLSAILRSEEFQPGVSDAIRRWITRAWQIIRTWAERLSFVQAVLVISAGVALLALVGYLIWRSLKMRARPDHELSAPPGTAVTSARMTTPLERLEQARRLVAQGYLREAAATLQHALLLSLCLESEVAWRANTTDWEWIALLRPSPWAVEMTRRTERIAFGSAASVNRGELDACMAEVAARIEPARARGEP